MCVESVYVSKEYLNNFGRTRLILIIDIIQNNLQWTIMAENIKKESLELQQTKSYLEGDLLSM